MSRTLPAPSSGAVEPAGPLEGRGRARLITLALVLVGLAGPFAYAMAQPAYSTGDEMAHVDYAYQLWHGRLPDFFAGLSLDPGVGFHPDLQWVSQHPPLFYALLAPVVGPLVDAGHPVAAVMLARGVLIVMSALSVLAVRWAVRGAFPARAHAATVAALLYGLSSWLPRQGGAVYNDLPAVLAVTLATGFLFRSLRSPADRWLLVGLAVSLDAAALVRFSTLPLAALLLAVLGVHRLVVLRRPRAALLQPGLVTLSIAATSGWWWLRNHSITGNFQGSRADYWIQQRDWTAKSASEVVTSDFWQVMLQQFFSTSFFRPIEPWTVPAWAGIVGLFVVPLAVGVALRARDVWRAPRDRAAAEESLVLLTLLGTIGLVVATQVLYSMSSGSALPRYFFALVPAAAALMAYAFTRARWAWWLLVAWLAARGVAVVLEVGSTIDRPLRGPQAALYPGWAWAGCAVTLVAATVVVATLRRSSATERVN